jgi:hypothetical protein
MRRTTRSNGRTHSTRLQSNGHSSTRRRKLLDCLPKMRPPQVETPAPEESRSVDHSGAEITSGVLMDPSRDCLITGKDPVRGCWVIEVNCGSGFTNVRSAQWLRESFRHSGAEDVEPNKQTPDAHELPDKSLQIFGSRHDRTRDHVLNVLNSTRNKVLLCIEPDFNHLPLTLSYHHHPTCRPWRIRELKTL